MQKSLGKIIARIHRAGMMHINAELAPYRIKYGQFQLILEMRVGEMVTQEILAQRTGLDKSTVTRSIKCLIAEGYLNRERSEVDGRAYRVTLTDAGKSLQPQIREILKSYTRKLLLGMENDKEMIIATMERVLANAEALHEKR